jgi:hypothetical protein
MTIQEFKEIQLNKQSEIEFIEKMKFAFQYNLLLMEKKDKSELKKEGNRTFISRNFNQNSALIQIKETKAYYVFSEDKNETFEVKLPSDFDDHYLELQRLVGTKSNNKNDGYRNLGYLTLIIGFILGLVLGDSFSVLSFDRFNTFNFGIAITIWVISFFAAMFWFWADDVLKSNQR